jgi:hypothetical protein
MINSGGNSPRIGFTLTNTLMSTRETLVAVLAVLCLTATVVHAQEPAVRQVGPIEHVSSEPLIVAADAVPLSNGRVFVNDRRGRRVLLFDSTLANPTIVADSTDATGDAYSGRGGRLIRFRGDTALFIDYASLSMLVFGPNGSLARVMAIPNSSSAYFLIDFGTPKLDPRGRIISYTGPVFSVMMLGITKPTPDMLARLVVHDDSGFVTRTDLQTRTVDTVATLRTARIRREPRLDAQGNLMAIVSIPDPIPVTDDWTVMADGTIAVVRGRDYHVDWIDADGKLTSTAKLPFPWRRLTDDEKTARTDSVMADLQRQMDQVNGRVPGRGAGTTRGGSTGRGGGGGGGGTPSGPGRPAARAPNLVERPPMSELPDYMPPFFPPRFRTTTADAVFADAENNLWIRTTAMVDGRPVYDRVNRHGVLFDRVQLPPFRTIIGFGPQVVYMAVLDSAGVAHVERARIR